MVYNRPESNGNRPYIKEAGRLLDWAFKSCKEIDACVYCCLHFYRHSYQDYFTYVCGRPHNVVSVRVETFNRWPAKTVQFDEQKDKILVYFFGGKHETEWVDRNTCYLLTQHNYPLPQSGAQLESAVHEMRRYINRLTSFGIKFPYYKARTVFTKDKLYLTIDKSIDKMIENDFAQTIRDRNPVKRMLESSKESEPSNNCSVQYNCPEETQIAVKEKKVKRLEKKRQNVSNVCDNNISCADGKIESDPLLQNSESHVDEIIEKCVSQSTPDKNPIVGRMSKTTEEYELSNTSSDQNNCSQKSKIETNQNKVKKRKMKVSDDTLLERMKKKEKYLSHICDDDNSCSDPKKRSQLYDANIDRSVDEIIEKCVSQSKEDDPLKIRLESGDESKLTHLSPDKINSNCSQKSKIETNDKKFTKRKMKLSDDTLLKKTENKETNICDDDNSCSDPEINSDLDIDKPVDELFEKVVPRKKPNNNPLLIRILDSGNGSESSNLSQIQINSNRSPEPQIQPKQKKAKKQKTKVSDGKKDKKTNVSNGCVDDNIEERNQPQLTSDHSVSNSVFILKPRVGSDEESSSSLPDMITKKRSDVSEEMASAAYQSHQSECLSKLKVLRVHLKSLPLEIQKKYLSKSCDSEKSIVQTSFETEDELLESEPNSPDKRTQLNTQKSVSEMTVQTSESQTSKNTHTNHKKTKPLIQTQVSISKENNSDDSSKEIEDIIDVEEFQYQKKAQKISDNTPKNIGKNVPKNDQNGDKKLEKYCEISKRFFSKEKSPLNETKKSDLSVPENDEIIVLEKSQPNKGEFCSDIPSKAIEEKVTKIDQSINTTSNKDLNGSKRYSIAIDNNHTRIYCCESIGCSHSELTEADIIMHLKFVHDLDMGDAPKSDDVPDIEVIATPIKKSKPSRRFYRSIPARVSQGTPVIDLSFSDDEDEPIVIANDNYRSERQVIQKSAKSQNHKHRPLDSNITESSYIKKVRVDNKFQYQCKFQSECSKIVFEQLVCVKQHVKQHLEEFSYP